MSAVHVYEITSGITTHRWLCAEHVTARRAAGWTVKAPAPLPDGLPCSDCEMVRQAAPGYVTPHVPFVPPDPASRLPNRAAVARMPGVAPMKTWPNSPKKIERKKAA